MRPNFRADAFSALGPGAHRDAPTGLFGQTRMQELGQSPARVVRREDADDLAVLNHDGRAIFMFGHRLGHDIERSLGIYRVDVIRHRFVNEDFTRIDVAQGLHEVQIAFGDHSEELAPLEHREVPDVMGSHHFVRALQRLIFADGVGGGGHELLEGRDGLAHVDEYSRLRASPANVKGLT